MSKVTCNSCEVGVTPRLWHKDENNWVSYRSIEHICPLCGETMYVTGGGLTPAAYTALAVILWFSLAVFWQGTLNLNNDDSGTLAWVSWSVLVTLFIAKKFFGLGIRALFNIVKNKF